MGSAICDLLQRRYAANASSSSPVEFYQEKQAMRRNCALPLHHCYNIHKQAIMATLLRRFLPLLASAIVLQQSDAAVLAAAPSSSNTMKTVKVTDESIEAIRNLEYRTLPMRTKEEAAVLEWGHSAIISALDASVAHFGPQTSQAALLEVEAMPVLASPINGVFARKKKEKKEKKEGEGEEVADNDEEEDQEEEEEEEEDEARILDNADEIHGNVAVMTNAGNALSGVEMARLAQASGAAALLVVNLDEDNPEYIYRLPSPEQEGVDGDDASDIQIPVAMISLNSANALTSATVTPETRERDIVNNGMPDRVRLYSGGDRPFFEDVEAMSPTVYLIHNLLTEPECDQLIDQSKDRAEPLTGNDPLQLTSDASKFRNVDRVMLWRGLLHSPQGKQIEERIEQVTGFPASHFSDFVVDRLAGEGSYWMPHVDTHPENNPPLATITVFLTEADDGNDDSGSGGGELVFPSTGKNQPIKIKPVKGLAVVHHNTDEDHELDVNSVHALLPNSSSKPMYVARKFIFTDPLPKARRAALPVFALPFGGKLPAPVVGLHDILVDRFGPETGGAFFDKACVFLPALVVLCLAQYLVEYVQRQLSDSSKGKEKQQRAGGQKGTSNDAGGDNRRTKKKKN